MKKRMLSKGNVIFGMMVVLFALLLFMGISNTVAGREDVTSDQRAYYHELEERFQTVLRKQLENDGLGDCGITLSSITTVEGIRTYQVLLHHHRLSAMTENEQQQMLAEISGITFPDKSCRVIYEILP